MPPQGKYKYSNMNSEYYLGYQTAFAGASSQQAEHNAAILRGFKSASQTVETSPTANVCNRSKKQRTHSVNVREQQPNARNKRVTTVENKYQPVVEQDEQEILGGPALGRSKRRQAMIEHQQVKQRQREETEAQRAAAKEIAAADRRAALAAGCSGRDEDLLEGGANSAAPLRFVKVPKGALRPKTGAASSRAESNSPGRIGRFVAQSSDLQCSTGKQTGSGTPTTPGQKTPARAAPNSPAIPAGSSVDAVKEQHHKALVFCRCCYCMSAPTWRKGTLGSYKGETLCNSCGIWENRHGDLTQSDKVNRLEEDFYAKYSLHSPTGKTLPASSMEAEQPERSVMGHQQGSAGLKVPAHNDDGSLGCATGCFSKAAVSSKDSDVQFLEKDKSEGSQVGQHHSVQHVQLACGDEASGTDTAARPSHKRRAANSILEGVAKRRAGVGVQGSSDAAAAQNCKAMGVHQTGSPYAEDAAHAGVIHKVGLDGVSGERRVLRVKKSKDRGLAGCT